MTSMPISGRCLCGAVRFTAVVESHDVTACHCTMCNRWAGGIWMYVNALGAPAFQGAENIAVYRSSEWGERGFCKVCGSSLFWKMAGEDRYTLSTGVLDQQASLRFAKEIFVEDKPPYYAFANDTVKQSGEEAMAAYFAANVSGKDEA